MSEGVLTINMQSGFDVLRGGHAHPCPECYENVDCGDDCGVFFGSVADDGTPLGHHVVCARCTIASPGGGGA